MGIGGVSSSATAAIQSGMRQLDSAAQNVASNGVSDVGNLTQALVSGKQASQQVAVGAKMLATADEMLGTLIDTFA